MVLRIDCHHDGSLSCIVILSCPDKPKSSGVGVVPPSKSSVSSTGSDSEGQGSERPLLKNSGEKKLFRKKKVSVLLYGLSLSSHWC